MNDEINIGNDRDLLEDAEGHAIKARGVTPAEDDTDGHAMRAGRVTPAEDDADGHAFRSGR